MNKHILIPHEDILLIVAPNKHARCFAKKFL